MKAIKLTTIFVLLLCTSTLMAQSLSSVEYENLKMEAGQSYQKKEYFDAYQKLMKLYRENPTDKSLYLPIAKSAYNAKNYNQSLMAYERVLETNSNNPQIYIEMAIVYFELGDFIQALVYLELGKAKGNKDQKQKIDKLIAQVNTQFNTTNWKGGLSFGFGNDSNANFGPDSLNVILGEIPLTLSDASAPQEAITLHGSFNLSLEESFSPRNTKYMLISDLNVYSKIFAESDVVENSFIYTKFALGLRTVFKDFYIDLQGIANYTSYNLEQGVTSYGFEGDLNAKLTDNLYSLTSFSFETSTYDNNESNDGNTFRISEQLRLSINNKDSLSFQVGLTNRTAQVDRLTYNALDANLRYAYGLSNTIYLVPSVGVTLTQYEAPATIFENENREDTKLNAGATAIWYYKKNKSVDINYRFTSNDSSSPIYIYEQKTVSLSFSRYF